MSVRVYLDIETTFSGVNDINLYQALAGAETIVTFNGSSFDLPIIRKRLLADLKGEYQHCDLLYVCRKRGLQGGLKVVEQRLGIARDTTGVSGWDAPRLWNRYEATGDAAALALLLDYNREDVVNLALLEDLLAGEERKPLHPDVRIIE
jgi:uncharacterized protein